MQAAGSCWGSRSRVGLATTLALLVVPGLVGCGSGTDAQVPAMRSFDVVAYADLGGGQQRHQPASHEQLHAGRRRRRAAGDRGKTDLARSSA